LGLVGAGLAVAKSETMKAAGRSFGAVRFVITDLGRATVASRRPSVEAGLVVNFQTTTSICAAVAFVSATICGPILAFKDRVVGTVWGLGFTCRVNRRERHAAGPHQ
jgi:hypothetical protein